MTLLAWVKDAGGLRPRVMRSGRNKFQGYWNNPPSENYSKLAGLAHEPAGPPKTNGIGRSARPDQAPECKA